MSPARPGRGDGGEDPVARELIREHIEDCRGRMARVEEIFDQLWSAINAINKWRIRILQGVIALLVTLNVSLLGYIFKSGLQP